jgi:hypothetical protein
MRILPGGHVIECDSIERIDWTMALNGSKASIFYSDPPWNDGNIRYWNTIAKRDTGKDFRVLTYDELLEVLLKMIRENVQGYVFIEIGVNQKEFVIKKLEGKLFNVRAHDVSYRSGTKLLPNVLISAGTSGEFDAMLQPERISKLRGAALSNYVIGRCKDLRATGIVMDPCCGLGLTAQAAINHGFKFYGNEVNQKRLEKTMGRLQHGN